jgi:hypothetical protein
MTTPRNYRTRKAPTARPRYVRSGSALDDESVDESILGLWEEVCAELCKTQPAPPLEALAVLDLIARDATRLVDEQIVTLLRAGGVTPAAIGKALGMSRQAILKRGYTWIRSSE